MKAKYLKLFLVVLSLLSIMSIVDASTVTITAPASGAVVTGTYNFTATVAITNDDNITYCNFSTTDDGVFAKSALGNITGYWNETSTTGLTDSASTTVTVTCNNNSNGAKITGTVTGVKIDNSDPTCSFVMSSETVEFMTTMEVDGTASADSHSGISSYAWTLTKPDGTTSTATTSIKEFSTGDFDQIGTFTVDLTVTNGAALTSSCSQQTLDTRKANNAGKVVVTSKSVAAQKSRNNMMILMGGIVVVLLACSAFVIMLSNRKK